MSVTDSEDTLTIPLIKDYAISKEPRGRQVDEAVAVQTLYLLDRFGVSDEFYHELTQVCARCILYDNFNVIHSQMYPDLQRSHVVKSIRRRLNSEVDIISVANGAYRPFVSTLSTVLRHVVSMYVYLIL